MNEDNSNFELMCRNFCKKNDYESAISAMLAKLDLEPNNRFCLTNLGAYFYIKSDFLSASKYIDMAIENYPHSVISYFYRVYLLVGSASLSEVVDAFKLVREKFSNRIEYRGLLNEFKQKILVTYISHPDLSDFLSEIDGEVDDTFFKNFESIGSNCEFGLVQREFGFEPLSLFRWVSVSIESLINILNSGLDTYLQDADYSLVLTGSYDVPYYSLINNRFSTESHTFILESEETKEVLLPKLLARQKFLARKFLQDVKSKFRIYVFVSSLDLNLSHRDKLSNLLNCMGARGLLVIQKATANCVPGTIEFISDRLFVGYVSSFMPNIVFDEYSLIFESLSIHLKE